MNATRPSRLKYNLDQKRSWDAIIVGAGVSGLECARLLKENQLKICVVEAKDRVGGRLHSVKTDEFQCELGAEFIHGAEPDYLKKFSELRLPFIDVPDDHLFLKGSKLIQNNDFWDQIEKVSKHLNPKIKKDRSLNDFLKAHKKSISPAQRTLLKSYMEGFQAVDIDCASERSMAQSEAEEEPTLNGKALFRTQLGYSNFSRKLLEAANVSPQELMLKTEVVSIQIAPDGVIVKFKKGGVTSSMNAKRLILTVPLGVLKKSPALLPLPEMRSAIEPLFMGHVQRINFHFKERFWEKLSDKPVSFLHAPPESYFPTWWTQMPQRTPILIAWQGGPKAEEMSSWTEQERNQKAFQTLSMITRKSMTELKKLCLGSYSHNWSLDLHTLGAYSFVGVTDKKLYDFSKPFGKKIWITGEHAALNSGRGTVHGALNAAQKAAMKVIKSLQSEY